MSEKTRVRAYLYLVDGELEQVWHLMTVTADGLPKMRTNNVLGCLRDLKPMEAQHEGARVIQEWGWELSGGYPKIM